jgi:Helix-turn-helix of insertion element transposase
MAVAHGQRGRESGKFSDRNRHFACLCCLLCLQWYGEMYDPLPMRATPPEQPGSLPTGRVGFLGVARETYARSPQVTIRTRGASLALGVVLSTTLFQRRMRHKPNQCQQMLTLQQKRFLDAFRQTAVTSSAARLAGVHRATVYRWRADPAFAEALRAAADEYFQEHRIKVLAELASRQEWRKEREQARRPMRCDNLARARAAKRR